MPFEIRDWKLTIRDWPIVASGLTLGLQSLIPAVRRRPILGLLFMLVVLAGGCSTAAGEFVVLTTPSATLMPATPTATLTPTPLPTRTPTATATLLPSPTPMPTPRPTPTEAPLEVTVSAPVNSVVQGHVVTVKVRASRPVTVTGTLGDQLLPLTEVAAGEYWTIVGIHVLAEPGPRELVVQALDELGRQVQERMTLDVVAGDYVTETITLSPEVAALLDPELVRAERERLEALWAQFTPRRLWENVWTLPGGAGTTSTFGTRRSYNGGPVTDYHAGQDFLANRGDRVMAPAAGTVVLAEPLTVRGNTVWIDHGLGIYSGYFHLSEIAVEAGQAVEQGDLLGLVGSTGLSTGSHIHWEVRVRGIAVDPLEWTQQQIGPPVILQIAPGLQERVR